MECFVVAEFLLTSALHGPSAIAEPLVEHGIRPKLFKNLETKLIHLTECLIAIVNRCVRNTILILAFSMSCNQLKLMKECYLNANKMSSLSPHDQLNSV